jgi:4a-hydroxytetrahydrobiopterin dehydratase
MDGSNWITKEGKLYCRFEFQNFAESLAFVNKVGDLAEKTGHHPDITFGWGYAEITLYTHSENSISDKDYELAKQIDLLLP